MNEFSTAGDASGMKAMKDFLLRRGHKKEELDELSREDLKTMYNESARAGTLNFLRQMSDEDIIAVTSADIADIGQFKVKVRENAENTIALMAIIRDAFDDFGYSDINDILNISAKSIPAYKLNRILRIAYREFQEVLLGKIAEGLKELPIEEYKTMMGHYEQMREDIPKLKNTLNELSDETKRGQILHMAHLKFKIVRDFMPRNTFNDVYKEYLNNTPEKLKLVQQILSLTGMHSKKYLKNLPIEELEEMKNLLLEDKRQDERDQKIFSHYTQVLSESMYGANEQEFSDVCLKIITTLTQKQILMISDFLSTKNPIFVNRFNTLLKDFKKIKQ